MLVFWYFHSILIQVWKFHYLPVVGTLTGAITQPDQKPCCGMFVYSYTHEGLKFGFIREYNIFLLWLSNVHTFFANNRSFIFIFPDQSSSSGMRWKSVIILLERVVRITSVLLRRKFSEKRCGSNVFARTTWNEGFDDGSFFCFFLFILGIIFCVGGGVQFSFSQSKTYHCELQSCCLPGTFFMQSHNFSMVLRSVLLPIHFKILTVTTIFLPLLCDICHPHTYISCYYICACESLGNPETVPDTFDYS